MKGEAEKYISMEKKQMEPTFAKLKTLCENDKCLHPENQTNPFICKKVDLLKNKLTSQRTKLEDIIADLEDDAKKYNKAECIMAFCGFLCLFPSPPEPVDGQAVLDLNRVLKYKGADDTRMVLQRGVYRYTLARGGGSDGG